jgi:subtilisin-like proprotein convertase family protein
MRVRVTGSHTYNSDLTLRLSGPNGQRSTLQSRSRRNPFRTYTVTRGVVGTQAQGRWTLSIADTIPQDFGRFASWGMELNCQ